MVTFWILKVAFFLSPSSDSKPTLNMVAIPEIKLKIPNFFLLDWYDTKTWPPGLHLHTNEKRFFWNTLQNIHPDICHTQPYYTAYTFCVLPSKPSIVLSVSPIFRCHWSWKMSQGCSFPDWLYFNTTVDLYVVPNCVGMTHNAGAWDQLSYARTEWMT